MEFLTFITSLHGFFNCAAFHTYNISHRG